MHDIRPCRPDERAVMLAIVNAAAEAYKGVIPTDCWHEPYLSTNQLEDEIAAGVAFWGYEANGVLVGLMGLQAVRDVDLIRHAYVLPANQHQGVGGSLLGHLLGMAKRRILVGTWADATWAIRFYQRHGFALVPREHTPALLRRYWTISDRQVETSVVLTNPPLELGQDDGGA